MAITSKSAVSARKRQAPLKAKPVAEHNPVIILLSSSRSAPLWLLRLSSLQRRSHMVTFLLIAGMLAVYSWTVYSQQMWIQGYRKLGTLQRDERQLTTTNEVLKNQMALQAEQLHTALIPSNPAEAVFLQSAPQRPSPATTSVSAAESTQNKQVAPIPLGY